MDAVEVHTENGPEGNGEDERPRDHLWRDRVIWLVGVGVLIGTVLLFVLIGSVDASPPGGCGGG
jgi:hypothetical protein